MNRRFRQFITEKTTRAFFPILFHVSLIRKLPLYPTKRTIAAGGMDGVSQCPVGRYVVCTPFVPNDEVQFPKQEAKSFYDFGNNDEQEWLVDEIIAHKWEGDQNLELQVHWTLGDVTWEPYTTCKDLEALDRYLELRGVTRVRDLACKSTS